MSLSPFLSAAFKYLALLLQPPFLSEMAPKDPLQLTYNGVKVVWKDNKPSSKSGGAELQRAVEAIAVNEALRVGYDKVQIKSVNQDSV